MCFFFIQFPFPLCDRIALICDDDDCEWHRARARFLTELSWLLLCVYSLTLQQSLIISGTSNVCHMTADCPSDSKCEPRSGHDGQCVCSDGYFMKSSGKQRECIRIADYGELCYMNKQCEFRLGLEAECRNGQCSCKEGAHYVANENACFNSSSEYHV